MRAMLVMAALAAGALGAPAARACAVRMSLETLADHAGQVIDARVVAVRSYWNDATPPAIESEVRFGEVDWLKGAPAGDDTTFTLIVPGGRVGDLELRVCCAPQYAVGERWVLFLLPEYRTYPVPGLSQGAFRIATAPDGVERVLQGGAAPVVDVTADGWVLAGVEARGAAAPPAPVSATGSARVVSSPRPAPAEPLSAAAFRQRLQPILDASRRHVLDGPAGRRVAVGWRSVPLVDVRAQRGGRPPARSGPVRQAEAER